MVSSASSKKKTLQAAISECGCEREKLRSFAAESCGMGRTSFRRAVSRKEESAANAVQ